MEISLVKDILKKFAPTEACQIFSAQTLLYQQVMVVICTLAMCSGVIRRVAIEVCV
jgi:hypothetical protein